jgi:hypothetical protein
MEATHTWSRYGRGAQLGHLVAGDQPRTGDRTLGLVDQMRLNRDVMTGFLLSTSVWLSLIIVFVVMKYLVMMR